MTVRER